MTVTHHCTLRMDTYLKILLFPRILFSGVYSDNHCRPPPLHAPHRSDRSAIRRSKAGADRTPPRCFLRSRHPGPSRPQPWQRPAPEGSAQSGYASQAAL